MEINFTTLLYSLWSERENSFDPGTKTTALWKILWPRLRNCQRNRSSVCSVGIVVVRDGEIVDKYYSLIQPTPNFYTRFTTAVHGLTKEDTGDARQFPQVWAELSAHLPKISL